MRRPYGGVVEGPVLSRVEGPGWVPSLPPLFLYWERGHLARVCLCGLEARTPWDGRMLTN